MSVSMYSVLTLVLVASVFAEDVAEVEKPTITTKDGKLETRLPRDTDATYTRTRIERDEASIFNLQGRVGILEDQLNNGDLEKKIADANMKAALAAVSTAVDSATKVFEPSVRRVDDLIMDLADFKANITSMVYSQAETTKTILDSATETIKGDVDTKLQAMKKDVDKLVDDMGDLKTTTTKAVADGKTAAITAAETAAKKNWCYSWANGIDDYNDNWKNYNGMKPCKLTSKSGYVKITLEGRTYGQNHGGLRVVGGGVTHGTEGTYGFQWMNSEHHGHRWLPFNIQRIVKVEKNKAIDYTLQHRSQCNGCRFHISGGNFAQKYSGMWFIMEEMDAPLSGME